MKCFFQVVVLLTLFLSTGRAQVVSSVLTDSRLDVNTRVRELNRLVDSLQVSLNLTPIEIMPETRSGNRAIARLDQRALTATFQEMYEVLGIEGVVPMPMKPMQILSAITEILVAAAVSPPTVQTIIADGVEEVFARLRGAVTDDGNSVLTDWGFKVGMDSVLMDSIRVPFDSIPYLTGTFGDFLDTSAVDTGSFFLARPDLSASTTYFFAAWAENSEGIAHGDTLSFVTLPGVVTEEASDITDSTATITGSISFGDVMPSSVGFKWGLTSDLSVASDTLLALETDSTITLGLSGLQSDSAYYFAAFAENASGVQFGDTLQFSAFGDACEGMTQITYHGHDYGVVSIAGNCYFTENLRTETYANGDSIPGKLLKADWAATTSGAQAVYGEMDSDCLGSCDSVANLAVYGRLYNAFAVNDPRGLCPPKWRAPDNSNWAEIMDFYGGGGPAARALKASGDTTETWTSGTNASGFSVLPAGTRFGGSYPNYSSIGMTSYLGSRSPLGGYLAVFGTGPVNYGSFVKQHGVSVRCMWDPYPSLKTDSASSISGTRAMLHGNLERTGDTLMVQTGFHLSLDSTFATYQVFLSDELEGSFDAEATGLQPLTTHFFRAFATNAVGTTLGKAKTFETTDFTCGLDALDYHGISYSTLAMGANCWFAENLQTQTFANGDSIPHDLVPADWELAAWPATAFCSGTDAQAGNCHQVITTSIGDSFDDVEQEVDYENDAIDADGSGLKLGRDDGDVTIAGLRFSGMNIPPGAEIQNAYIQFTSRRPAGGIATDLEIAIEDSPNPSIYTLDTAAITLRAYWDTTVAWNNVPPWTSWGEAGMDQRTPNLSQLVQYAVNHPDWAEGNALAFKVTGTGTREAYSFDGSISGVPRLIVDFKAPDAAASGTYGSLYNWYAVSDDRGLCPTGWRVPSDHDWTQFVDALGGEATAGEAMKASASDSVPWDGSNASGFAGLPGGYRNQLGGFAFDSSGSWWSSTDYSTSKAWSRGLNGSDAAVTRSDKSLNEGQAVRCLLDTSAFDSTQTYLWSSQPSYETDDARESGTISGWKNINTRGSDHVLGEYNRIVGLRFPDLKIAPGQTIVSAHIQFQTDEVRTGTSNLTIAVQDDPNPLRFDENDDTNISSRPVLDSTVAWSPPDWNVTGEISDAQKTPELKDLIQAIVDKPDWAVNNALVVIISGSGERSAMSFEGNATEAPRLVIETLGPPGE